MQPAPHGHRPRRGRREAGRESSGRPGHSGVVQRAQEGDAVGLRRHHRGPRPLRGDALPAPGHAPPGAVPQGRHRRRGALLLHLHERLPGPGPDLARRLRGAGGAPVGDAVRGALHRHGRRLPAGPAPGRGRARPQAPRPAGRAHALPLPGDRERGAPRGRPHGVGAPQHRPHRAARTRRPGPAPGGGAGRRRLRAHRPQHGAPRPGDLRAAARALRRGRRPQPLPLHRRRPAGQGQGPPRPLRAAARVPPAPASGDRGGHPGGRAVPGRGLRPARHRSGPHRPGPPAHGAPAPSRAAPSAPARRAHLLDRLAADGDLRRPLHGGRGQDDLRRAGHALERGRPEPGDQRPGRRHRARRRPRPH